MEDLVMSRVSPQGETSEARIQWGRENKRCPYCGADVSNVKVVGSGRFEDGQFCSLDCYACFHYGPPKEVEGR